MATRCPLPPTQLAICLGGFWAGLEHPGVEPEGEGLPGGGEQGLKSGGFG